MAKRTSKTYSQAFKRAVVDEIVSGTLSVTAAHRRYKIGSRETIYNWLRAFGHHDQIGDVIHVKRREEVDQVRKLEQEKQELESALAQAQMKIIGLEALIEVAGERYGTDLKKSFDTKR